MSIKATQDLVDAYGSIRDKTHDNSDSQDSTPSKRLRYKDIAPRYMFNRSLGLIWYRIFQGILVYWMLMNFASACTGPIDYGCNYLYPNYCTVVRISCFIIFAICFRLFVCTKRYSYSMLRWVKFLGIATAMDDALAIAAQAVDLDVSVPMLLLDSGGKIIGACIASCIWAIPTYRYMRRRWLPDEYVSQPTKPIQNDGNPPSIAVSTTVDTTDAADSTQTDNIEPALADSVVLHEDIVPDDSSAVDRIEPAKSGSDQKSSPTESTDTLVPVRFCRYCGNELRTESKFCDNCGKKVRK